MAFFQSIKVRLLAFSILLGLIPVVSTSLLLGSQASSGAEDAIATQVENQLISIREIKKIQVEDYLKSMHTTAYRYSVDPTVVTYMQKFSIYYSGTARQLGDTSTQKSELVDFYNGPYADHYKSLNAGYAQNGADIVAQFEPVTIALQHSFLVSNDAPFGEKHYLINPEDGTSYANAHDEGHRQLKRVYEQLGVSELYLIDPNGNIVYSVHKNPDFATNLNDGPYKNTVLADVYTHAIKSDDYETVAISDIQPYSGVFGEPSIFIASPIQDLLEEDAYEILGVLVIRVPVSQLDSIMNSNAQWENIGMGKTGDAYIIGSDNVLRTNSRLLVTEKDTFLSKAEVEGTDKQNIETISLQNTAISHFKINRDGINAEEATSVVVTRDMEGKEYLTAYTPVNFKGLNWTIVSEIESAEAFTQQKELNQHIFTTGLILTVVIAGLAIFVGFLITSMIIKPIVKLSRDISEIEENSDLSRQLELNCKGELGKMVQALNRMLAKFRDSMNQVAGSTTMLATASEELSAITQSTYESVNKQFHEMDQTATAINEMSATVQGVAQSAQDAAGAAETTNKQAMNGKQVVESTIDSINDLSTELNRVAEVINNLNKESEGIGAVMDVIKGIAEQTNLLALNAAIEAARAGEQGRGFAVVADEVRTLASRTQQSTVEIEGMIEKLQKGAQDAVQAMESSRAKSEQSVQHAAGAGDSLVTITESVDQINEMNMTIASAAEEQSAVTEEINKNIVAIRQAGEETTSGAEQNNNSSAELSKLAAELQHLVAQFKT